jgi:uncharacterized protein YecT (DUF1311 family)
MNRLLGLILLIIISTGLGSISSKVFAEPVGDQYPGAEGCGRFILNSDVISCLAEEANAKDAELNAIINTLMSPVDINKKENKKFGIKFFKSQKLFEKYREYDCRAIEDNYSEGRIAPSFYYSCYTIMTDQRIKIIEKNYALILPSKNRAW